MYKRLARAGSGAILLCVLVCSWSGPVQAQTSYKYQITLYGFATGVNGTIGEHGRTAAVDASFGDVLDHLNMVAMIYFDARFGRWRALVDNLYVDVSNARATPAPSFDSVRVATRMWMVDPEGAYAITQNEGRELDVTAGARIWNLDNSVSLFRGGFQVDRGAGTRSLADPIIGARYYSTLTPNIFVLAKADIGGFSAGASTDWQAYGQVGYKLKNSIVVSAGYRYLGVHDEPKNAVFDIHLNGVIVGLGIRF
jgi:opacity protein-like surface antigen